MVAAGDLRHRVTLQSPNEPVSDGEGGFLAPTWTTVSPARRAAKVESLSNRERVLADTVQASATHRVTIRHQAGVTTKMRLLLHGADGDRTFSVTGVQDLEERRVALALLCHEVVA